MKFKEKAKKNKKKEEEKAKIRIRLFGRSRKDDATKALDSIASAQKKN